MAGTHQLSFAVKGYFGNSRIIGANLFINRNTDIIRQCGFGRVAYGVAVRIGGIVAQSHCSFEKCRIRIAGRSIGVLLFAV